MVAESVPVGRIEKIGVVDVVERVDDAISIVELVLGEGITTIAEDELELVVEEGVWTVDWVVSEATGVVGAGV